MNEYGELIDQNTVRFSRLLPGTVAEIWRYLGEPDLRARWFCGGATELVVGGSTEMRFNNAALSQLPDDDPPQKYADLPQEPVFSGKVTRCEPPKLLAHTWEFGDEYSEVCYELEQRGEQVLLTLTHSRLKNRDEVISVCGGWHTHLDILGDVLEEREPRPFWRSHTGIEESYESRL